MPLQKGLSFVQIIGTQGSTSMLNTCQYKLMLLQPISFSLVDVFWYFTLQHGDAPIHNTTSMGNFETTELLIDYGADLDIEGEVSLIFSRFL